jgi:leader peptidase (prepilin peptidase)/N-methyltransferase
VLIIIIIFELAAFPAFLFGLLMGSFLNVCISRLPRHESVVKPRSRCPECGAAIRWYDNIPILSWIFLRARCRDCKATISWRYPLVELLTGIWFAVIAAKVPSPWAPIRIVSSAYSSTFLGFVGMPYVIPTSNLWISLSIELLAIAILGFLLIGLLVMDWQTHLLPDAFTLTGIAVGLFNVCTQTLFLAPHTGDVVLNTTHQLRMSSPGSMGIHGNIFLTGTEALIFGRIAAIVGAAGLLLLIRWLYQAVRHREGLGLGDVKLLAMIAAFLGFWPAILSLFIGVLAATAYAIVLLLRGRANALTRLPLGSFISIGGLVAALFGERIINIYATMFR